VDEDPNNDVTTPCPDCGEVAIPCPCEKGISTVGELQRALEAAGVTECRIDMMCPGWCVTLTWANREYVSCTADSMSCALDNALDVWWNRVD
jgi:hypothetical protein